MKHAVAIMLAVASVGSLGFATSAHALVLKGKKVTPTPTPTGEAKLPEHSPGGTPPAPVSPC
jgi:hypothetical protein